MNSRWSTVIMGGLIAALVMAAGALGALFARPATTVSAQSGAGYVRQVTVVGTGEARATPDRATIQIGVQSEAATAREAMTDNNGKMAALIDQLKQLGIAAADIQTSNFNISPTYSENGRTVRGYMVNNTVSVIIRDVAKAGDLLDQIVSAGANTIYGLSFGINDPKVLQATARDSAIADARTRAEAIVAATGGTLGQVLSITENIGSVPPPMPMGRAMEQAAADNAPIEAGEQAVSAQVQITYEIR